MHQSATLDLQQIRPARQKVGRVVLMGASNLSRFAPLAIDTTRALWGNPLDVLLAKGHGRSYGCVTGIPGWRKPGLANCGLWEPLEREPNIPTAALLTDIGNDLLFGTSVDVMLRWVESCLDRLLNIGAHVVVTQLPIDVLPSLGPRRYKIMSSILFPQSGLTLADVTNRSHEAASGLERLCAVREIPLMRQPLEWYGYDPIHHVRGQWKTYWRAVASAWLQQTSGPGSLEGEGDPLMHLPTAARWRTWWQVRTHFPERVDFFGRTIDTPQPVVERKDGGTVSLY